jgi:hypothetical protein
VTKTGVFALNALKRMKRGGISRLEISSLSMIAFVKQRNIQVKLHEEVLLCS